MANQQMIILFVSFGLCVSLIVHLAAQSFTYAIFQMHQSSMNKTKVIV